MIEEKEQPRKHPPPVSSPDQSCTQPPDGNISTPSATSNKSKLKKIDELLRKQVLQESLLPNHSGYSTNSSSQVFDQVGGCTGWPFIEF